MVFKSNPQTVISSFVSKVNRWLTRYSGSYIASLIIIRGVVAKADGTHLSMDAKIIFLCVFLK